MAEPKQITDLDELAGKTIKLVAGDSNHVLIAFDDGTFFRVHAQPSGWDDESLVDWRQPPDCDYEFVEVEMMTYAEFEVRRAKKRQEDQERQAENDRREYERLKVKFEGPPRA